MRPFPIVILLICVLSGPALAEAPAIWSGPGSGAHNQAPGGRDVCWSEPGDLEGYLSSSEIISEYDVVSEWANDFVVEGEVITRATWWGGQYGVSVPCTPEWPTPGFTLRFYEDADCLPGALMAELPVTDFTEELVGCGYQSVPLYKYSAEISVPLTPGVRYWFSAQFMDHPASGQGGRLSTVEVTGCEATFRSDYFGYHDWHPSHLVFQTACDYGQEFECGATPVQASTWGNVKALYR